VQLHTRVVGSGQGHVGTTILGPPLLAAAGTNARRAGAVVGVARLAAAAGVGLGQSWVADLAGVSRQSFGFHAEKPFVLFALRGSVNDDG